MTRITIDDLRQSGIGTCERVRRWGGRNGINWRDFKKNGIDADELRGIKDGETFIRMLIETAERRQARKARRHG